MIESVQYNATLAITGAMRGSSREKLYQELGFESLRDRRWYRKLCFYYKIRHNDCPLYLTECIPIFEPSTYSLRSNHPLNVPIVEHFKSTFSPHPLLVGTNLTQTFKIHPPLKFLNEHYLNFIRPKPASIYKIHHPRGLKLLNATSPRPKSFART